MHIDHLWLTNFRCYESLDVVLAPGLNVIEGANGSGKTNLLEGIHYLASSRSLRGAPTEALIRAGFDQAIVRGSGRREQRDLLIEAEIRSGGRGRVQINKQRVRHTRDLALGFQTTVFQPDDMGLVKAGPGGRREYLDDLLRQLDPAMAAVCSEVERVLKQRNALLKQSRGRRSGDVESTLAVWDAKFTQQGERLGDARQQLLDDLRPYLQLAYREIAGSDTEVEAKYEARWRDKGLAASLDEVLDQELRRGVSLVGPHRDELALSLAGLPSRTHASQGEQRTLALAMRLAGHRLVTDRRGSPPILLLDDIFSELDPGRCSALLASLPAGQTLLSTAGVLPEAMSVDHHLRVSAGSVAPV